MNNGIKMPQRIVEVITEIPFRCARREQSVMSAPTSNKAMMFRSKEAIGTPSGDETCTASSSTDAGGGLLFVPSAGGGSIESLRELHPGGGVK